MNKSPKKLWKRSLGIVLTAVMVMTAALPTAAYGVELNARAGGFSEAIAGTIEILAGNGNSAENGIWLTQSAEGGSADAEAAMKYLQDKYVAATTKIISGSTQEKDTCHAILPSSKDSFRLAYESGTGTSLYKSGWYINDKKETEGLIEPAKGSWVSRNPLSINITHPKTDKTFKLTLKLFPSGTEDDVINGETTSMDNSAALASQEFLITIKGTGEVETPSTFDVSFTPVDSETNAAVAGAKITLEENWSTVYPTNGVYKGLSNKIYTLKITADGYQDYKENFTPSQSGEVKIPMTKASYSTIKFNVKDSAGKSIKDAKVKVKQGYYDTVSPQSDGSYNLKNGVTYNYTVEAVNYTSINSVSFIPSGDQTIDITMTKNISQYNVTFKPVDSNDKDIADTAIKVTYEDSDYDDDWNWVTNEITVDPEKDGSYKLDKSTKYTYTITADGYEKRQGRILRAVMTKTLRKRSP